MLGKAIDDAPPSTRPLAPTPSSASGEVAPTVTPAAVATPGVAPAAAATAGAASRRDRQKATQDALAQLREEAQCSKVWTDVVNAAPAKAGGTRSKRQQLQQKARQPCGNKSAARAGADEDEADKAVEDDVDDDEPSTKGPRGRGSGQK